MVQLLVRYKDGKYYKDQNEGGLITYPISPGDQVSEIVILRTKHMDTDAMQHIHDNELKVVPKVIDLEKELIEALEAIKARTNNEFDNPSLEKYGTMGSFPPTLFRAEFSVFSRS